MYEFHCEDCELTGFHPSMTGAESRAEVHVRETGHSCIVKPMEGEYSGTEPEQAES